MDERIYVGGYVRVPLIDDHGHKFTAQARVDGFWKRANEIWVSIGADDFVFDADRVTYEPIENVYPELANWQ